MSEEPQITNADIKLQLEIEKLQSEKDKISEEVKQLKIPLWRRPAYLSIFIPVLATIILGSLNLKNFRDRALTIQNQELLDKLALIKDENQKLDQKTLELGNKFLLIEKNDIKREKDENQKLVVSYATQITESRAQINGLKSELIKERRILQDLNLRITTQSDSLDDLRAIVRSSSINLSELYEKINKKKISLDSASAKLKDYDIYSQLITTVGVDLKGLLIRFYTSWRTNKKKGDNELIRQDLISINTKVNTLFIQIGDKSKIKNEFDSFEAAVNNLINDNNAFKKISVLENIGLVKEINDRSDKLIYALKLN